jgi:hypothetical protein
VDVFNVYAVVMLGDVCGCVLDHEALRKRLPASRVNRPVLSARHDRWVEVVDVACDDRLVRAKLGQVDVGIVLVLAGIESTKSASDDESRRRLFCDLRRFARMVGGVSVFERFTSLTLTEAKAHADTLRTRKPSSFGDKSVTVESLATSYLERESGRHGKASARTVELRRSLLTNHVVPLLGPRTKAVDVDAASLRRMIEKLNERGLPARRFEVVSRRHQRCSVRASKTLAHFLGTRRVTLTTATVQARSVRASRVT